MTTESSSSTSAATTNLNEDNRVVGESGSIALGKNATYEINNFMPDTVADVFKNLIDLASDAGQIVVDSTQNAVASQEKALSTIATLSDKQNQGDSRIYTDLFPFVAVGVMALIALTIFKKGK